jgi:hypothetical protein
MVADGSRYTDAGRLRECFEPCRHVYAVTMNVAGFDDHVSEVYADAEFDPVFRDRDVALVNPTLYRDRTSHGFNDAREFDQKAVASCFDDPAFVLGDVGINQFTAMSSKPVQGASFVPPHEAAISGDIGGEDGREPAFDPRSAQLGFLPLDAIKAVCSRAEPRSTA